MAKHITTSPLTGNTQTAGSPEESAYSMFLMELGGDRELKFLLEESAIPRWFTLTLLAWLHEVGPNELAVPWEKISRFFTAFLNVEEGRFSWEDRFRRMLLSQIPDERRRNLHRSAARYRQFELFRPSHEKTDWLQEDRLLDQAIEWIYHLLAAEPERGMSLLHKFFTSLEREFALGRLSQLLEAAEEQSSFLSSDQRLEVRYLRARWARQLGRLREARDILESMRAGNLPPLPPHLDARILQELACIYEATGEDWSRTEDIYRESIRRHRQSGDMIAALDICLSLAQLYRAMGRQEQALAVLGEALESFGQQLSDPIRLGRLYEEIGMVHLEGEEWIQAFEAFRQSQEQFERAQYQSGIARVLFSLGRCSHALGNEDQAQEYFRQSLQLVSGERGSIINLPGPLKEYPQREQVLKRVEEDILRLRNMLEEHQEGQIGEIYLEPLGKLHMQAAGIEQELGNIQSALEHYSQALQIFEGAHADRWVVEILLQRAALYKQESRYAEAMTDLQRAMPILKRINSEALSIRAQKILEGMPR